MHMYQGRKLVNIFSPPRLDFFIYTYIQVIHDTYLQDIAIFPKTGQPCIKVNGCERSGRRKGWLLFPSVHVYTIQCHTAIEYNGASLIQTLCIWNIHLSGHNDMFENQFTLILGKSIVHTLSKGTGKRGSIVCMYLLFNYDINILHYFLK